VKQEKPQVLRMIKGVLAAPDDALACDQIIAHLPAAVDATIVGDDITKRFPQLVAHLELCSQCRRQFEELLDITQMAEAGSLPEPKRFPQFDLQQVRRHAEKASSTMERGQFLVRFRQHLEALQTDALEPGAEALRELVRKGASSLALLVSPVRPEFQPLPVRAPFPLQTRQLTYRIEAADLQITLNVREFERHRFTIRGLIEGDQAFDGLGVALLSSDDEPLDSTRVDDANTFSFHSVSSGHYSIQLDITPEESIHLTDVDI
jgi:hypothetical protein